MHDTIYKLLSESSEEEINRVVGKTVVKKSRRRGYLAGTCEVKSVIQRTEEIPSLTGQQKDPGRAGLRRPGRKTRGAVRQWGGKGGA